MPQILHVDYMCNECGNCTSFCPYNSSPYKEKFTYFNNISDFEDSKNEGFVLLDEDKQIVRVRLGESVQDYNLKNSDCSLYVGIKNMILAVIENYHYILMK
jgi:putative selenate reductase